MASHLVLGRLARLAGADMVVYPIESGKYRLLDERYRQIAFDLVLDWHWVPSCLSKEKSIKFQKQIFYESSKDNFLIYTK